jgi:hypothetical protein
MVHKCISGNTSNVLELRPTMKGGIIQIGAHSGVRIFTPEDVKL